jgi:hypothetical protein
MAEITYATAWRRDDWKLESDAKAFWAKLGLVSAEERERRAKELCSVAYAEGEVIGVTTVTLTAYPPLRCRFAFYRCAVAPEYRRHYLATFLTRHTLTTMEQFALDNPHEKLQGLAAILQAHELMSKAIYPQWADWNIHLNLIGYSQRGEQVRVAWFRQAKLEDTPTYGGGGGGRGPGGGDVGGMG